MRKRAVIIGLLGLNLALAAIFVFANVSPPTAMAQSRGRPGDYTMATIKIHEDYDVLALIHLPTAKMYFFVPRETGNSAQLVPTDMRDLNRDFQRQ